MNKEWTVHNPGGERRVIVTKQLPGERWLAILEAAGCSVEVCTSNEVLSIDEIKERIGNSCDGVIGQLTEDWNADLFAAFAAAGGAAYSNYAVGYNNVDVAGATAAGIPVGNTPGVLTETTAEMAAQRRHHSNDTAPALLQRKANQSTGRSVGSASICDVPASTSRTSASIRTCSWPVVRRPSLPGDWAPLKMSSGRQM